MNLHQRWLEMANEDARRELEAFLQPRFTDTKPLATWPQKPLKTS